MQLEHVYYELYELDLQALESRAWAVPHELDGQVRLEFFDASAIYVSAIQCRDGFCAHYRGAGHFANPSTVPARRLGSPALDPSYRFVHQSRLPG